MDIVDELIESFFLVKVEHNEGVLCVDEHVVKGLDEISDQFIIINHEDH